MTGDEDAVVDPDGRTVVFDAGTRLHLALSRPELAEEAALILSVVARPDHREADPRAGRERFYRQDLDRRRWLRVIVEEVEAVVAAAEKHAPLTILVTAAGTNRPGPTTLASMEDVDLVLDTNVRGTFIACRAVGRRMLAGARQGRMVLMSSQMGTADTPGVRRTARRSTRSTDWPRRSQSNGPRCASR